jgi:ABC-type uncharacterized transport system permease subunit
VIDEMFVPRAVLLFIGNMATALWGAIIRHLLVRLKREYNARAFALGIMSALFLGMSVSLLYQEFGISYKLSLVISGILGYTGVDSIELARRVFLMKKFGLDRKDVELDTKDVIDDKEVK